MMLVFDPLVNKQFFIGGSKHSNLEFNQAEETLHDHMCRKSHN